MPTNPVAENVLGTMGAVCWTVQLIPQVWKSWREKSTDGLSPWLVLLWGIAAGFLGAYAILLDLNVPLILQPQLFGFFSLLSWGQCQYYAQKRSARMAALTTGAMLVIGGFEAAMVFALRGAYGARTDAGLRGVQFLGISSSVIISLALFPQYVEIWRLREVVGISVLFVVIDLLGSVFSDLSLAFKDKFDIIAAITYSFVVALDAFVILAALILNPRATKRRRRENAAGVTEDEAMTEAATMTRVASSANSNGLGFNPNCQ
ncbi:PQ-loop-domain-containing protein [Mycena venus]|uniref:PQ-loop-domain-containing protein n=1 Tax=Mycena venus TaxID=2733690 RepID=A0A8H6X4C1_9AGAR|nr:PQ-loop-domain-containing protein [Mycena venus]